MNNPVTVNLVVGFLGFFALLWLGGTLFLASSGKTSPDSLTTAGSVALGALASILASTQTKKE